MNTEEKLSLITRNLEEVLTLDELKKLLKTKKEPSVYWGTMPTGSPHVAYFLPMIKIHDFLKANLKVKVLIADLHAFLDGIPWEVLEKRQKYYESIFPAMLKALDVDTKKLEFIKGSKIQLSPKYQEDVLKMSMITSVKDSIKASSEVVKMGENPKLGNLIYPIMQALDEEYLNADIQFGGIDQRKIFVFARENLPKIGYKSRIELMNPMIQGLTGEKMSASISASKIDLLDDGETINKKIKNANCEEGNPKNGIMQLLKYLIFTIKQNKKEKLKIKRPEKFGGDVEYTTYEQLEKDFTSKKLHPLDVKNVLAKELGILSEPIRKNKTLYKLHKEAYPE